MRVCVWWEVGRGDNGAGKGEGGKAGEGLLYLSVL